MKRDFKSKINGSDGESYKRSTRELPKMGQQDDFGFKCRISDNSHVNTQQEAVKILYLL